MKTFQEYVGVELATSLADNADALSTYKIIQERSQHQNRLDKATASFVAKVKNVDRDPQALVAMDSICIQADQQYYAKTKTEKQKCSDQLSENMDAILAVNTVKNPAEYRSKVMASGATADHSAPPKKDAFLNIVNRRIQQLGTSLTSLDANDSRKALYGARQENLNLAKKLYIDLQKEALNPQAPGHKNEPEKAKEAASVKSEQQQAHEKVFESLIANLPPDKQKQALEYFNRRFTEQSQDKTPATVAINEDKEKALGRGGDKDR